MTGIGAAVIGTGFIGVVHVEALRRLGVEKLYNAVYAAVEEGHMPAEPDFPTFAGGHEQILLGEAIGRSAREERWIAVER